MKFSDNFSAFVEEVDGLAKYEERRVFCVFEK